MRIPSGVTDQYIYFVGVDSTDYVTRETGLSSFTVYRSRNGAAAAAMTTPTINETDVTNMPGVYELLLDEDMTIGAGNDTEEMVFHITHAGMAPVSRTIELYRPKITAGEAITVSSGAVSTVTAVTNQVTADMTAISGDTTAANNAESFFDGTGYAGTNNVIPTVTTLTGHTAQTGDTFALANGVNGFVATKADTAAILTDTGTTLDTKLNDIQGATFSSATDSLEAIRDRGDAAWVTGAGGSDRLLMVDTTIATLASQTSFTLAGGSTDDDAYNNCTIVIEDVSTAAQKAVGLVSDYTGATKTVTLKYDPGIFTMATTDKVYILAENALKSTDANRQLDVTATGAAGIDWANVENPTTAVDLSATDIQLADTVTTLTGHTVQTGDNYARIGAPAGASVSADVAAVKAETATIVTDTNELQTDDVPGLIAALNDISVADVLTTQMTEAYAADGAAPTVAQALHMIQQMLGEFAISGTTLTVKKVDGSTTAGTFTLDDATTPTSITRAT